MTRTAL